MEQFRESEIARFYNGRSVFITGATGFMGKVLLEKLLRSCPGIKCLYLLLRNKKGFSPKQRLEQLTTDKIFDRLREEDPSALDKIISIEGDITLDGLGISANDLNRIVKNVSVIFHSAATIKFNEPIKVAVNYNILGTRRVINLAKQIPQLDALVHVSTAYANCDRPETDEIVYEQKITPKQIIEASEWMTDKMMESIESDLLGARPNSYTLTKALAETMIMEEAGSLPVAIVRPTIVTAAQNEPYQGWIDNVNHLTGMFTAYGKGLLRTIYMDTSLINDLIPVDYVINLMIAVAWNTATNPQTAKCVYNCSSGVLNPVTNNDLKNYILPVFQENPCSDIFRYPKMNITFNRFRHKFSHFYDHYIPAYIADAIGAIFGKNRRFVKIYDKIHTATDLLEFFETRQWQFKSSNVPELFEKLAPVDQKMFCFDVKQIDWPSYLKHYALGIRRFVLKEDDSTIPKAKESANRLYLAEKLIGLVIYAGLLNTLLSRIEFNSYISSLLQHN